MRELMPNRCNPAAAKIIASYLTRIQLGQSRIQVTPDIFKTQVGKWCRSCAKRRREDVRLLLHLGVSFVYLDAWHEPPEHQLFRSVTT